MSLTWTIAQMPNFHAAILQMDVEPSKTCMIDFPSRRRISRSTVILHLPRKIGRPVLPHRFRGQSPSNCVKECHTRVMFVALSPITWLCITADTVGRQGPGAQGLRELSLPHTEEWTSRTFCKICEQFVCPAGQTQVLEWAGTLAVLSKQVCTCF